MFFSYFWLMCYTAVTWINDQIKKNLLYSQMTAPWKWNLALVISLSKTKNWSKHQFWGFMKITKDIFQKRFYLWLNSYAMVTRLYNHIKENLLWSQITRSWKQGLALVISLFRTRNGSNHQLWDLIKNVTDIFPKCFLFLKYCIVLTYINNLTMYNFH